MSNFQFVNIHQKTALWKSSLAGTRTDQFPEERSQLRNAYNALRKNVAYILTQIQSDLPALTLHDLRHVDALWTTSDLLIGPEHNITPLESFLLGCSILLHDAGLTLASFPGGIGGLKQTE